MYLQLCTSIDYYCTEHGTHHPVESPYLGIFTHAFYIFSEPVKLNNLKQVVLLLLCKQELVLYAV